MKIFNKVYIKVFSTDWRIAHLYEHMVLRRVRAAFFAQAGYPDISVTCNARTFEQSFVEFTAALTEKKQKKQLEALLKQPLQVTEANMIAALREIEAEEGLRYAYDMKRLVKELTQLSQSPWTSLSALSTHDFGPLAQDEVKPSILYPTGKQARKTIEVDLFLPYITDKSPEYYQAFPFISQSILSAIATGFEADYSFHNDAIGSVSRNTRGLVGQLRLRTVATVEEDRIRAGASATLQLLQSKAAVNKLVAVTVASYEISSLRNLFATWEVFDTTRILTGFAGIQKLVTPTNVRAIIAALEVRIRVK